MRTGLLRMPIAFEIYTESRDSLNQIIENWVFYCKAWGKPLHQNQTQYWAAAQVQAEGTILIETRYIPQVLAKLMEDVSKVRIKSDTRVFKIKNYFDPDERKKRLHMIIEERM